MADPATGATTTPQQSGSSVGPTTNRGDNTWLSTMETALPAGIALYQAGQATRAGQRLTNAVSGAAAPQLNLGNATVGQMTGGPSVGGPMGQYISGATGAANQLAQTAGQYAGGNLTPAQQQQVQSYASAQKGQVASGLAGSGNLDSSTRAALNQEVDNNTAMLTQSLVNQNLQMAANALQAATGTYNAILTTSLNQTTLGTNATMNAVKMQLQNDQEVATIIQQILAGISSNATTAAGGQVSKQGGQTPGQQLGAGAANLLQKLGIGTGASDQPLGTATDIQNPFASDFAAQEQGYIAQSAPTGAMSIFSEQGAQTPTVNVGDWQGVNIDTSGGGD